MRQIRVCGLLLTAMAIIAGCSSVGAKHYPLDSDIAEGSPLLIDGDYYLMESRCRLGGTKLVMAAPGPLGGRVVAKDIRAVGFGRFTGQAMSYNRWTGDSAWGPASLVVGFSGILTYRVEPNPKGGLNKPITRELRPIEPRGKAACHCIAAILCARKHGHREDTIEAYDEFLRLFPSRPDSDQIRREREQIRREREQIRRERARALDLALARAVQDLRDFDMPERFKRTLETPRRIAQIQDLLMQGASPRAFGIRRITPSLRQHSSVSGGERSEMIKIFGTPPRDEVVPASEAGLSLAEYCDKIGCPRTARLLRNGDLYNRTGKLKVICESLQASDITEIRELIGEGVIVDVRNKHGVTLLFIASERGLAEIVKLLLDAKANVNVIHKTYHTTPLLVASRNGHAEVVKLLLEAKANVNVLHKFLTTPLFVASLNGHAEVVKLLLATNVDVNVARKIDGSTSLFMASQNGHAEVVKLLLEAKADVNATQTWGGTEETALSRAKQRGHTEVVRLLKAAGAK